MMNYRWLLPFTHGVDIRAIEEVVCIAQAYGATLVPVSLISVSPGPRPAEVRLEQIEQSKDFLVVVQRKAAQYQVSLEYHEVFTADVGTCIALLAKELCCDSLVLVMCQQQGILLSTEEVASLLVEPPTALVLARLSGRKSYMSTIHPVVRLLSRLRNLRWRRKESEHKRERAYERRANLTSRRRRGALRSD